MPTMSSSFVYFFQMKSSVNDPQASPWQRQDEKKAKGEFIYFDSVEGIAC